MWGRLRADWQSGSRGGDPEGVVIFHTASGQLFKKTIKRPLSRLLADHAPMPVELSVFS